MASMEGDTAPLFRLPEELLEIVVEQALADSVPAAVLLETCRRFARITRKLYYARIKYGGAWASYIKLVDLLETRPDLQELVKDGTWRPVINQRDSTAEACAHSATIRVFDLFPSLKTLRITDASPKEVAQILARPPGPVHPPLQRIAIHPPLQHVAIELPAGNWRRFSALCWWEALARFPDLGELTLLGTAFPWRNEGVRADPGERSQAPAMPRGLHTLTIQYVAPPTDGAAAFADDLPALTNLALADEESTVSRWLSIAPLSLTRITLDFTTHDAEPGELAQQLGRFPRLQHLRLVHNFKLHDLVPFLRTDKLRHLDLHYDTTGDLTDDLDTLLDLICGPDRIRHLQSINLGSDTDLCETGYEDLEEYLCDAIKGTDDMTLAEIKSEFDPFHGQSVEENFRRLVEGARSNGIKIAGHTLRAVDWERQFEDMVERHFVEHALATNDYTILQRQYGKEGAIEAIRRQRPLLAAMLSGDGS